MTWLYRALTLTPDFDSDVSNFRKEAPRETLSTGKVGDGRLIWGRQCFLLLLDGTEQP